MITGNTFLCVRSIDTSGLEWQMERDLRLSSSWIDIDDVDKRERYESDNVEDSLMGDVYKRISVTIDDIDSFDVLFSWKYPTNVYFYQADFHSRSVLMISKKRDSSIIKRFATKYWMSITDANQGDHTWEMWFREEIRTFVNDHVFVIDICYKYSCVERICRWVDHRNLYWLAISMIVFTID